MRSHTNTLEIAQQHRHDIDGQQTHETYTVVKYVSESVCENGLNLHLRGGVVEYFALQLNHARDMIVLIRLRLDSVDRHNRRVFFFVFRWIQGSVIAVTKQ